MAIPENDNQLWAGFNNHGLYAKRAERDKNGNPIDTTYATKDTATTTDAGLMSAADKSKLDNIESGAEVNLIESVKVNGTVLSVDANKAVNIPLADGTATGVVTLTVESGKVTEISGMPVGGSELPDPSAVNQLLTSTAGGSDWKQLAKTTVPEQITDESGSALTDESGDPLYDERGVELWSSFDGTGFLAGRAAADTNGNDIVRTYATKDTFNGSVPGLVPVAAQGTNTRYLRPDGTWSEIPTPSVFSGSDPGLVPAATAGDATKALRGDGTWGDVSSVAVSYDAQTEELHLDFSTSNR